MTKKTVGYLRASTNDQRQDVSHQKASIERFAKANNMVIDDWYSEYVSAYSTSIDDRDEIQKIKQLAISGQLDTLIIFEQSRLARNMVDAISILDTFTRCNVKVYSVKDGKCINQNDIDKLMNAFTSYFSEQASRDTSARIKSQKKLAKEKGEFLGGPLPYGFKVVDSKVVVDEELKPIVVETYNQYLDYGCKEAMDYLNMYTDRYKVNHTMLQYLRNPRMVDIVGEELYNKFMNTKSTRNPHANKAVNKGYKEPELIEGLVYHQCGYRLTTDYPRGVLYYRCRKCKTDKAKIKKNFVGQKLTRNVENEVLKVLNELDKDKLIAQYEKDNSDVTESINKQIRHTELEIRHKESDVKKANENLQKLIISDITASSIEIIANTIDAMNQSLEKLKAELKQLNIDKKLEEHKLEHQESLIDQLLDFKYLYSKGTKEQKRAILIQIIDKIIVRDNDNFTIFFKF